MPDSYEITIKRSAEKEIKSLPREVIPRIVRAIQALAGDPRPPGSVKLSGREAYRVRVGRYRIIIYSIFDEQLVIEIVGVAHRSDVYR